MIASNPIQQFLGITDPDHLPLLDLKQFSGLHMHVFWKDKQNRYRGANDQLALDAGLRSGVEALDHSDRDFWPLEALHLEENDAKIVHENRSQLFIEYATMRTGEHVSAVSHKAPWISARTNKLLGIMGVGFIHWPRSQRETYDLSQRQLDCLSFLVKGNTIKQIAKQLSLSPRTVEHYLEAAKDKLNCYTRAELIEKGLSIFY